MSTIVIHELHLSSKLDLEVEVFVHFGALHMCMSLFYRKIYSHEGVKLCIRTEF